MSDTAQLRAFLTQALPWAAADEPQTYVGIHWRTARTSEHTGKPFWGSKPVETVDAAINQINYLLGRRDDIRDVYVCMGSQRETTTITPKSGRPFVVANKDQSNIVALKSLFLDVDVKGGDKGYEDQPAAQAAAVAFFKEVGLPRPSIFVQSGGGLHIHWTLDRALTVAEWQPLADALAEATRQKGLKCDTQCTVDSSRILRPPQTLNWKTEPPKETRIVSNVWHSYPVEVIQKALEPFVGARTSRPAGGEGFAALPKRPGSGVPNQLNGGIEATFLDLDVVAGQCGFVKEAIDTGGADYGQPLWNLTTLLATFAEDGRTEAHRMAKGHPEYTPESTDALFERKMLERMNKNLGWPQCRAIQNAGCASCASCPHLAQGKSPGNLGFAPQVALPPAPANDLGLPAGYRLNDKSLISVEKRDDFGSVSSQQLIDYEVASPWLQEDPWKLTFDAKLYGKTWKKIDLDYGVISSADTLNKALFNAGMTLSAFQRKHTQEFFVSWIKTLQARKNAVVNSKPFGWNVVDGEIEGFVFGGWEWSAGGSRPSPNSDTVLQKQYGPQGEAEHWRKAAELVVGHGRPELETVIATAFGAPLMKFTGWDGALISAYSQESGIGKTTAMKIAQAVWGNPRVAMQGLDDTSNAVLHKIGKTQALPLYWDEIKTDEDTRKFVKLAFQLTGGKEKSRMGRDTQLREVGYWQTLLVSATNESLLDHITAQTTSTTAGIYRIFEFDVAPKKMTTQVAHAQSLLNKINDHYGKIGLEYAQWMGANFATIEQEVKDYVAKIERDAGLQNDERFWLAAITCVVMGATFAKRLGYADFDVPGIEKFMLSTLSSMRFHVQNTHVDLNNVNNVMNVLTQFLKDMRRHTLKTNKICTKAGKPKKGDFTIVNVNDLQRLDGVHVQIGAEDKVIRISVARFSKWANEHKLSTHILVRQMEKAFNMGPKKFARLGSGTDRVESTEYLYQIDANGTPLQAFIDDEVSE